MKWGTIILCLYMSILAALPCQDVDAATPIGQSTISSAHKTGQGACNETCPPFCNCNCCPNTRWLSPACTVLPLPEQNIATIYASLRVAPLRHRALPIWQPPQLS